ncbi:MAG: FapA family protein [Planctomycetota bacterium]
MSGEKNLTVVDGIGVSVSEGKMSVLLDVDAKDLSEEMLLAKVQDRMSELKITAPFDRKALQEKISENGGTTEKISGLIIARGKPLTPSVDGHIKWVRDFFSKDWLVVNATGRVDYRERSTSRVLKSGDLAGNMVSPKSGSEGQDVFGKPAVPAKPKPNPYRCGKNVRLDEEAGSIYATMDGMLRVTNNTVELDEVYELEEANLGSGNVRFSGAVIVHKEVEDLVVIEAGGTVEIGGTVGAARIEAKGDVLIGRGVSGRDKAKIKSNGSMAASFILNADIEAEEDVTARKEIVQCNIRSRGSVRVEGGRIVGGKTVALGEITVSEAGSEGNISTLLAAGEDYKLPNILKEKNAEAIKLEQNRRKIHDNIEPLMGKLRLLSPKQREAVTELMAHESELDAKIASLRKEIEEITGKSEKRAGHHIRIQHTLYPGVTLRLLGFSRHITKLHKGPITVSVDTENDVLIF